MDTDLFQGVLLGLLAVGLLVLIALLATLGGIRRALEQRSAQRGLDRDSSVAESAEGPPAQAAPAEEQSGPVETQAAAAEAQAAPAETASVSGYTGAGSYATPVTSREPSEASGGQADTIRSVLQEHGVSGGEEQPAATGTAQEPVVDSAFAAHADDPQEEPFQRDGRWWFRRGNELLLYDEASGQWQPAPEGQAPDSAGGTAGSATPAATQTQSMPAVADQVATFWKCPTCGAVNGSTAATCRMCFAARP